jgi:lipopolysaccharide export LptBFGC system permease protein LptF
MVNWKTKLASRKFWVAVVGFVTALALAFGADSASVEKITGIIMAGATLIAYILGESWIDAKSAGSPVFGEIVEEPTEEEQK